MNRTLPALLALLLMGLAPAANAQALDDVELKPVGVDAIARFRFNVPVQYQRTIISGDGKQIHVFYNLLPGPVTVPLDTPAVERNLGGMDGVPGLRVSDESLSTADVTRRRLRIQFAGSPSFVVRPGPKKESIELVLTGAMAASQSNANGAKGSAPAGRFVVVLQSFTHAGETSDQSIPASVQDKEATTVRRIVNGQERYDFQLGNFASRGEAEQALALVQRRFPGAAVLEMPAADASPATLQAATQPPPVAPLPPALQAPAAPPVAAVIPAATPEPSDATPVDVPVRSTAEIEQQAADLMAAALLAEQGGDFATTALQLENLLALPPNSASRKAQELIGILRLKQGDRNRARAEFESFLKLYPNGTDSDQIRLYLANLPPPEVVRETRTRAPVAPVSVTSGSLSTFYYGGQSKVRSQTFQDDPLGGLPVLISDNDISAQDQSQIQTNFDMNWRYRDAEIDQRFVLRESYASDLMPNRPDRERLSAAYYEQRDLKSGTHFKLGRQSPIGAGMLYRFDGAMVGYRFSPQWKVNAVYGVPTDPLLDSKRYFYGVWVDADAITPHTSATVYFNEQRIDNEIDRSAIGLELRYFNNGAVVTGQMDYDQVLQGLNTLSAQGSWMFEDNSSVNFMLDRRTVPLRALGNALFYQDPTFGTTARSIRELLLNNTIDRLRSYVNSVTPFQNQAMLGFNKPISEHWQSGANLNYTNVDEVKPVPDILPNGQASTGDLWGVGAQLIGSNLYSARDTHVFSVNFIKGPTYNGQMLSYNNMTGLDKWQVEPYLRYYTQTDTSGMRMQRWTPGLRLSYRPMNRLSIESDFSYEIADTTRPTGNENATRMFYYLGARYDF